MSRLCRAMVLEIGKMGNDRKPSASVAIIEVKGREGRQDD
jgi:hypothetical protein